MSAPATGAARGGSGEMFDAIAARYDLLNRIISLGVDQRWRRRTVASLRLGPGARVLDLATGTADLAVALARAVPDGTVVGLDPSAGMLAVGERKIRRLALDGRVQLLRGDAQALPFPDDTFDGATIAFGIRNVPDRPRALAEMARVVRPSGRVAVLELAEPRGRVLGSIARFHVHTVVPWLGSLLSGAREYRYLQDSIARFPPPAEFAAMMESAGLAVEEVAPLTFGACCLFVARPHKGSKALEAGR